MRIMSTFIFSLVFGYSSSLMAAAVGNTHLVTCQRTIDAVSKYLDQSIKTMNCIPGDTQCLTVAKISYNASVAERDRLKKQCSPLVRRKCDDYAKYALSLGPDNAWRLVMNNCTANAYDAKPTLIGCACHPVDYDSLNRAIQQNPSQKTQ